MRNIFTEVDPTFQSQADAQRGGPPVAPNMNGLPAPVHFETRPDLQSVFHPMDLEKFFAAAAPGSAVEIAPAPPPVPHSNLRSDFQALAEKTAPRSPLK